MKKYTLLKYLSGKFTLTLMFLLVIATIVSAMAPSAGQPGAPQQAGGGLEQMLILFLPLMIIWWFLLIRPQQKREKERKKMMSELKKGEEILTIGGIHGSIVQVKEDRVIIKTAGKTELEITKSAISAKVPEKK